ncbi:hypothetical protein DIPPA_21208 [Diplonema papillatum]|nr:hypothetical protein DIPPA_21208 [Diplonema papillatum]
MEASLWESYAAGRFADCTVAGPQGEWRCHKVVLAASSRYFDRELGDAPRAALPLPAELAAAFDDLLPVLYGLTEMRDISLEDGVPLYFLASLLGVDRAANRLLQAFDAVCQESADAVGSAALLSVLTSDWVCTLENDVREAMRGRPRGGSTGHEVIERGLRESREQCGRLKERCVAVLAPLLPRLPEVCDHLTPRSLLSLVDHPSAGKTADPVRSAAVSAAVLKHLARDDSARLSPRVFSQLCAHVDDIPAGDLAKIVQLAVTRKDADLLRKCLASAVSGTRHDDIFAVMAALKDTAAATPRKRPRDSAPAPRPGPANGRLSDPSDADEGSGGEDGDLFATKKPKTAAPSQVLVRDTQEDAAASQDLTRKGGGGVALGSYDGGDGASLFHHEMTHSSFPNPGDGYDEDDDFACEGQDDREILASLSRPLSQPEAHRLLDRFKAMMASHREKRNARSTASVRGFRAESAAKAEYVAEHCDVLWGQVRGCQEESNQAIAGMSDSLRLRLTSSAEEVAGIQERCAALDADLKTLRTDALSLDRVAQSAQSRAAEQITSASQCAQQLVDALREDLGQAVQQLERRLNGLASKDLKAIHALSSLLAQELSSD